MRSLSRIFALIAICLSILVLFSCSGSSDDGHDATGVKKDEGVVTFAEGLDSIAPGAAANRVGKRLYTRYCQVCHGEEGAGDGFNAYNLQSSLGIVPADLTDSTFVTTSTDSSVLSAISDGSPDGARLGCLLPWGQTLSPLELIDVAGYVRTLATKSAKNE